MKKSDFQSFQRGMAEARAFSAGARDGYEMHEPERGIATDLNLDHAPEQNASIVSTIASDLPRNDLPKVS